MIIVISHCRHIRFVFAYLFNILGDAAAPQCPMQCITNSRYRYCAYYVIAFHSTAHSTCQCQTQSAPSHASTHATHDRRMTSLALANYGIKSCLVLCRLRLKAWSRPCRAVGSLSRHKPSLGLVTAHGSGLDFKKPKAAAWATAF